MFKLVEAYTGMEYMDGGMVAFFEDGRAAANAADSLNSWSNPLTKVKWQPRRMDPAPDIDWKARESERMTDGTYQLVPEFIREYMKPEHFVHVSKTKDHALAYTVDDERGKRDIQTRINLVNYLVKNHPELRREKLEELSAEFNTHFLNNSLSWAISADEIEHVYTNYDRDEHGLNVSCMRYSMSDGAWRFGAHPVRAYGDSDLRCAYLKGDDGKTISRCMVYEAKKVYSRIYGNGALHTILRKLGYKPSYAYYGYDPKRNTENDTFIGAKVRAIPSKSVSKYGYLMPYIDEIGSATFVKDSATGIEWFVLDNEGGSNTKTQNGVTSAEDEPEVRTFYCDGCEDDCDEEDTEAHEVVTAIPTGTWHRRRYGTYCTDCYHNDTFTCQGSGDTVADGIDQIEIDGNTYAQAYAEAAIDYTCCDNCSECTTESEGVITMSGETESDQQWCRGCVRDYAVIATDSSGERHYYAEGLIDPASITAHSPRRGTLIEVQPTGIDRNENQTEIAF